MGPRVPSRRLCYGYYRKNRDSESKKPALFRATKRGKNGKWNATLIIFPISLFNLHPGHLPRDVFLLREFHLLVFFDFNFARRDIKKKRTIGKKKNAYETGQTIDFTQDKSRNCTGPCAIVKISSLRRTISCQPDVNYLISINNFARTKRKFNASKDVYNGNTTNNLSFAEIACRRS